MMGSIPQNHRHRHRHHGLPFVLAVIAPHQEPRGCVSVGPFAGRTTPPDRVCGRSHGPLLISTILPRKAARLVGLSTSSENRRFATSLGHACRTRSRPTDFGLRFRPSRGTAVNSPATAGRTSKALLSCRGARPRRLGLHGVGGIYGGDLRAARRSVLYGHSLRMNIDISSGREKTTAARSPCMPLPTMTGLPVDGPSGLPSVLNRRLNSHQVRLLPSPVRTR